MSVNFRQSTAVRRLAPWISAVAWSLLMVGLLVIAEVNHARMKVAVGLAEARATFRKDMSYRFWNSSLGEVYTIEEDKTATLGKFEQLPRQTVETKDGRVLSVVDITGMPSMVHDINQPETGIHSRLTSLKPIEKANEPDPWESKALGHLQSGLKEYYEITLVKGVPTLRFMGPMYMTQQCLKCHASAGYKSGELRGGLSIFVPFDETLSELLRPHALRTYLIYGVVWLLGLIGISVGFQTYNRSQEHHDELFKELLGSEQRFRFFFKNAPAAYLVLDPEYRISSVNDAACSLTGFSAEDLLGKQLEFIVDNKDHAHLGILRTNIGKQGFIKSDDLALKRSDGSIALCAISARKELETKDSTARTHCILRDVTEQRRIQKALRESEARYRLIANNTGDVTWLLNLATGILEYVSPSCQRALGIPPEQLTGKRLIDCLAAESTDWVSEGFPSRLSAITSGDHSQMVLTHQVFFKSFENLITPMEVVSTVMLDPAGIPSHMVGLCRDISGRLQYERALNALLIGTAYSTGEEFTQALVRELASVLGMRYVLLARHDPSNPKRIRSLAFWAKTQLEDHKDYEISGTAAEEVLTQGIQCYWEKIQESFPSDIFLKNLGIESYLGVPLLGKDTQSLGLLIAMDPQPVPENPALLSLLTLFAARASTEIERSDAIDALAERERRFRAIVEMGQAGYMRIGASGLYEDVNDAWLEMHGYQSKSEVLGLHYTKTLAPQDTEEGIRLFKRILSGTKVPSGEFSRLRKDGSIAHHSFSLTPVMQGDRPIAVEGFIIDTTRLRKAQSDAAMLFNEMIDAFALCELVCDDQGHAIDYRYLAVNPAFERLTGLSAESVIGHCTSEAVPGTEKYWIDRYATVALTGEPSIFEDYSKPLGKWFSISAFQTAPSQFACIFIDVTDRRNAELKLEYDEAELAAIHEHIPMMLVLLDSDRKVRRCNRAAAEFAELTGLDSSTQSPGFFLGCFNAIHAEAGCGHGPKCTQCPLRMAINDSLQNGTSHQNEEAVMMLLRGDRLEETTVKYSTALVSVGSQSMVLLCLEDVTPMRAAETHIRRQAALLDITRDAICVLGPTSTIEFWNLGAERMFGWNSSEAVGSDWETLIFKRENHDFREAALKIRENGEWMGELRGFSRKGDRLVLQCRGTLVTEAIGTPGSSLLVCTDITEARKMEHQFLRMQRMDNLGSLTSGIAHDLNNILSPILMSADLLPPLLTSAEHQPLVQMLRDSAKRGAEIVQQLLIFSRGNETPRAPLEVGRLIQEMGIIISQTFPRNIKLTHACPDGLWQIMGDNTQIHQVLLNLCVNARDAMPDGGRLTITAENTPLDSSAITIHPDAKPGPYVVIQVSDTGQGIPPELIEKIFDPFFTTKPTGKGTGLGLSTVMAIVKSHGGFTLVSSHLGSGTDFRVFLPAIIKSNAINPENELISNLKGSGQTVLMVDDESSVRELMQMTLVGHNYEVLLAADGAQCLELYARHKDRVQVIFVDMMMPHLDGRLTIQCLRQMSPVVPIIAMSGMHEQEDLVAKLGEPNVRFLLKPFTIKKMLAMLRDALEHRGAK